MERVRRARVSGFFFTKNPNLKTKKNCLGGGGVMKGVGKV